MIRVWWHVTLTFDPETYYRQGGRVYTTVRPLVCPWTRSREKFYSNFHETFYYTLQAWEDSLDFEVDPTKSGRVAAILVFCDNILHGLYANVAENWSVCELKSMYKLQILRRYLRNGPDPTRTHVDYPSPCPTVVCCSLRGSPSLPLVEYTTADSVSIWLLRLNGH